tara:strand:- start:1401 stop:1505 length:105 start_codon:yes stop_codon:yes gene_type:complete
MVIKVKTTKKKKKKELPVLKALRTPVKIYGKFKI